MTVGDTDKAFYELQPGAYLAKQPQFTALISIGKQEGCVYKTGMRTGVSARGNCRH